MKIALISYEYPPDTAFGGIATYVGQAARVLAERGHHVEVFAASEKRCGRFVSGGIAVNLVSELDRKLFAKAVCPIFAARHQQVGFDVIESPEYYADGMEIRRVHPTIAHVVKLHTPTQLLEEISNCPIQWRGWTRHQYAQIRIALGALRRFKRPPGLRAYPSPSTAAIDVHKIERNNARNCDLVVSPSSALADWAIRIWGLDAVRVKTIPYPYLPTDKMLRIEIGGTGKVIGYFGRLEQRKGIGDLIDAIPLILKTEPEARFRFVGKPLEHWGTLERFDIYILRRLKRFRHAIEIVGSCPLDEMPGQYRAVNICVFPSIWENFPNVCLEAMAAGRAIVASTAGGMAEMLEGGQNGILVPPRSPTDIANAVIRLIQAPELQKDFGVKARQRVLDAYNVERIGEQLEKSFATAMELRRQS